MARRENTAGCLGKAPPRFPCPCCRAAARGDVWYDCRCFQGGKKTCVNCRRPKAQQDEQIAATMREWGWDKSPSPGMLDYLTPGWREGLRLTERLVWREHGDPLVHRGILNRDHRASVLTTGEEE